LCRDGSFPTIIIWDNQKEQMHVGDGNINDTWMENRGVVVEVAQQAEALVDLKGSQH